MIEKDKVHLSASRIPTSEYSETFLQGMIRRMGVSFHKYGKLTDAFPDHVDAIASLKLRLEKYEETGNTEFLVDAANFAMIEFLHPSHPDAYYEPGDSDKSPGRITRKGRTTRKENLDID